MPGGSTTLFYTRLFGQCLAVLAVPRWFALYIAGLFTRDRGGCRLPCTRAAVDGRRQRGGFPIMPLLILRLCVVGPDQCVARG